MLNHKLLGSVSSLPQDDNFENVTLLLSGDGTNGAQNNTFLDSSTNNFTITRNGNTTQGSFSPYGSNWSNFFSSSFLRSAASSALAVGSGNFTMEAWIFVTSTGLTDNWIMSLSLDVRLRIGSTDKLEFYDGVNNISIKSTGSLTANTWNHVAVVRSGTGSNQVKLYINGVNDGTGTCATNFNSATYTADVGNAVGYSLFFPGYISNVRVTKDAVYTANFTPSTTPLTAITNCVYLTCQSNRFIDNSASGLTITVNGTPQVTRFSPFNPTAPYSTSVIGGSGYFDGSGDYITTPSNSTFAWGTGDFTIECWLYNNVALASGGTNIVGTMSSGGGILYGNTTYGIAWNAFGVGNVLTYSTQLPLNSWNHVAYSRQSGTGRLFVNGALVASGSDSNNYTATTFNAGGTSTQYYTGYISNLRVVNSAVYTSAFTPPTAPVTAITNTSLLTNFTNAGIPDLAMMNDLETVGNAQVSTSVKKYGTGSLAFDGTGDYLYTNNQIGFPTNAPFTLELWFYQNSSGNAGIFCKGGGAGSWSTSNGHQFLLFIESGTLYWMWNNAGSNTQISTTPPSTGAWHSLIIGYNGTTTRFWIDGTSVGTSTTGYTLPTTRNIVTTGILPDLSTYPLNGYIDDLRFTQGIDRYGVGNSTITPPTSALPTY